MERGEVADDFDAFVVAQRGKLLRLAYLLTGDPARAEDIVQDALMKAFRHWGRVREAQRPEAYARTMVLHEFLSWRRRRSSRETPSQAPEAIDSAASVPDHAPDVVQHDAIWSILAGLPRRQRAVLVLRYYEALPDRQIAEHLGCAEGTVRSLAARAFATLREHPGLRDVEPAKDERHAHDEPVTRKSS